MKDMTHHAIGACCALGLVSTIAWAFADEPRVAPGYHAMTRAQIADETYAQALALDDRSTLLASATTRRVNEQRVAGADAPIATPRSTRRDDTQASPKQVSAATRYQRVAGGDWERVAARALRRDCAPEHAFATRSARTEIVRMFEAEAPVCDRTMLATNATQSRKPQEIG